MTSHNSKHLDYYPEKRKVVETDTWAHKFRRNLPNIMLHIMLIMGSLTALLPFFWMVSTSFKEPSAIFAYPPQWIPDPVSLEGYRSLFTYIPFARQFLNTFIMCASIVIGQLIFSSMGAYAFARLRFPGRDAIFLAFLSTMMVPQAVRLVPQFIIVRELGWVNSYMGLIGPYVLGSGFATFLLRQFMLTIPSELEEAARIDGASYFTIFMRVILPLSRPALSVLSIFSFVYFWNTFLWPLVVTNSENMKVITVGVATLARGPFGTDWAALMAGSTLSILPLILAFFLAQRQFIEGITLTGMK